MRHFTNKQQNCPEATIRRYRAVSWILAVCVVLLACTCAFICVQRRNHDAEAARKGFYTPNVEREYLAGGIVWQLSAESQGLMQQAFAIAADRVNEMMERCLNPEETDWRYDPEENAMYFQGKRAAIVADIDDTLVDGAHYSCDVVGNNGDYNNVAFARFVMSESCTALPGALEFIQTCRENGIEVYYVTNRSDRGYKIGQSDSMGSYTDAVNGGKGAYIGKDGQEIGASICQCLGKTMYDISLESMRRLGFPVDDRHLILNDSALLGKSKEAARQAIAAGCAAFPNGQRADENTLGTAVTVEMEPHSIVMMLGDNLADFTDDFSDENLDAVSRSELMRTYTDRIGTTWILLPNAMYGDSFAYAESYGIGKLLSENSYVK